MNNTDEIVELIKSAYNKKLEELLEANPKLAFGKTDQGISILQFACYCRNTEAVSILKKYKKELTFFEAASTGDLKTVKIELEKNPGLINSFSEDGFTALGLASFFSRTDVVKILLESGADPNIASNNSFKVTPLHSACAISNYDIVEILIKNGANVNAKQMQGVTPLHSAAHNGQTKIAKFLIKNGAEINSKTDDGKTPLIMAEEKGFVETARLIRQQH